MTTSCPPYNEASRNYVDHFPERFKEAIRRMGDRPRRMSEVLPDLAQEVSAGLDRLEQVYRRHGVKVFRTFEAAPEIINYFGYAQTGYWSSARPITGRFSAMFWWNWHPLTTSAASIPRSLKTVI